jgi:hypothetical protein
MLLEFPENLLAQGIGDLGIDAGVLNILVAQVVGDVFNPATSLQPAIFWQRAFVRAGGHMSYGPRSAETWQRMAYYVDRLLKGAKPADLPVERPTTFELVINLKTTQALGLTIPPTLLFQATDVIR